MAEFKEILKEAKDGSLNAQNEVGSCFLLGTGVEQNEKKAVKWFKKAAFSGHPAALANYGECLLHGTGVKKNAPKAIECFLQATAAGNQSGVTALAQCFDNESLSEDITIALARFREESSKYACVCYRLGLCYEEGNGVEADLPTAMIWYESAAEEGYADAQFRMGVILLKGTDKVLADKEKAIKLLKSAAEQRHADAAKVLMTLGISF